MVVFHGNKRTADPAELAEADVVLTTYSIIEGEHRRYVEPDKIPCKYCNKRFQPERLEVHLRYACHPAVMPHSVPGQPASEPRCDLGQASQQGFVQAKVACKGTRSAAGICIISSIARNGRNGVSYRDLAFVTG